MFTIGALVALLINISASVGVITINKRLVFMDAKFNFGCTLTLIHFIVTFLGCLFFSKIGLFHPKKLNVKDVLPISLAFCGYVVFNNLSLLTNSVSVYQVSKIFCTPVIIVIDSFYGRRESVKVLLSLAPICIGAFITTFSDSQLNLWGTFWCLLAIISNSLYTVWGKTQQVKLDAAPMQLLLYQAPISASILLFCVPFLDNMSELSRYTVTSTTVVAIALSCIFAFGVNFSFFLFVGKTSPLTVNVTGYLKTALVFIFGFLFVDSNISYQTVLGVTLTLVGLAFYTTVKYKESKETSVNVEKNLKENAEGALKKNDEV